MIKDAQVGAIRALIARGQSVVSVAKELRMSERTVRKYRDTELLPSQMERPKHSESFEALATGLQDAFHLVGGVPRRVRSDSLSAAIKNLSTEKEFTGKYKNLLEHYGTTGHRINVRKPHENGDVESAHGHIKDLLDQTMLIRGNRDFESTDEYMNFVRHLVAKKNKSRLPRLEEEIEQFSPLPARRLDSYSSSTVKVKSDSVIHVKRNTYSINSKYIGLRLEVRVYQDHLELWYQDRCVETLPRQFGNGKERIDFRHVIDSLVRKPGAFVNYKYMEHMFPTTRFRMAYDQLLASTTERSAVKQYLGILHSAKHEGLDLVDDILRWFINEGKTITSDEVLEAISKRQDVPPATDVNVEEPDLSTFDSLLENMEVYDDKENNPEIEISCDLAAYDEHAGACGTPEGATATNVSGTPRIVGGASSSGEVDLHPLPCGSD